MFVFRRGCAIISYAPLFTVALQGIDSFIKTLCVGDQVPHNVGSRYDVVNV